MIAGCEQAHLWKAHSMGSGALVRTDTGLRLATLPSPTVIYSNAQVDDHRSLPRNRFPWKPPTRLSLRARFSHPAQMLTGTAGFGFWNDPFAMNGRRPVALPHAAWFFLAAPPSDIAPALGVPGSGLKAAVMDVAALPLVALLPTAPVAIPLMRHARAYRTLWPVAQRVLGVDEHLLDDDLREWRSYVIDWQAGSVRFHVDDRCVLESRSAPHGPLGVVIWMDNQYLVATPQGRFSHGVVAPIATQWMEIADVVVD